MRYLSLCSGIEAATVAWHPLGWRPVAFSEIEKFPCAVLAHHYPDVPNWGDMTEFEGWPDAAVDVLVGGTPCQDFSVAGLRAGLDGEHGQLMLVYAAIARRYRPKWLVWENVPGVLSDDSGRGFASLLGLLSGQRVEVPRGGWQTAGVVEGYRRAYGLAWRVLDAQFVRVDSHPRAVPQRRRRVFVVGYLGDWRRAAAVLFDGESLSGNPAPRREAGQGTAPTLSARTKGGGGLGTDFDLDGGSIANTLSAARGRSCAHDHTLETYLPVAFGGNNQSSALTGIPCEEFHEIN
jgi:DNA (cytosine-5)-methyltransferase 1